MIPSRHWTDGLILTFVNKPSRKDRIPLPCQNGSNDGIGEPRYSNCLLFAKYTRIIVRERHRNTHWEILAVCLEVRTNRR